MKKLVFVLLLAAAAAPQPQPAFAQTPPVAPAASEADRGLKALYEGYSAWAAKEFGIFEDSKGETQQAGYLPKADPTTQLKRAEHLKSLLAALDAVPAAQLSAGERVNAAVLRHDPRHRHLRRQVPRMGDAGQ